MSTEAKFDLIVRGGTVFDGTGADPRRADIGIVDDGITVVGDLSQAGAGRTLDATGLHVSPGFIDIHTHSDISVLFDPGQASAIAMGVTTQVVGNCGLSLGFANPTSAFEFEKRWLAPHKARIRWNSFEEFHRLIEAGGVATNYVPLAGHSTLRKRVMGMDDRPPAAAELSDMRRELELAMQAGCFGLSSGLEYPPSAFADEFELTELCKVVKEYGGFYATHLRNEGDTLVESVQEALNVAEGAGVPLQLSHHKAEGRANWGKVQTTLKMVDDARARGLDVQTDQYPYTAFMTGLSIQTLPRWVLSGSHEDTAARLKDREQRARIAAELRQSHPDWDDLSDQSPWHNIQIGVCRGKPELQGSTVAALAAEAGRNPIDFVLDLLADTEGYVSAVNFAIGETDIAAVMRYPWTSIGSDGVGTHPGGIASADKVHPRSYGTFPRVLSRYVRELSVLREGEAIHKMTGLPAARLGLSDRGRIAPGFFADITVYDPARIQDTATFADPHQLAVGIRAVVVNGRLALENEIVTGTISGRILKK